MWLFYVLHGIVLIGLVKVEVRTSVSDDNDQPKKYDILERTSIQMGLWTDTIFEKIYIGNKMIHIEHSQQLSSHPTSLVTTVSVKRGIAIFFVCMCLLKLSTVFAELQLGHADELEIPAFKDAYMENERFKMFHVCNPSTPYMSWGHVLLRGFTTAYTAYQYLAIDQFSIFI
jgi:hypothetical protein